MNLQMGGSGGGGFGDETTVTDETRTTPVLSVAPLVGDTKEREGDSTSMMVLNILTEDIMNERPSASGECVITVNRNLASGLKSDGR